MNILFLTHSPKKGGAEQSMILLINSLSKERNINIYLGCPSNTEYIEEISNKVNIINIELNSLKHKFGIDYLIKVSRIREMIAKYNLDILYANGWRAPWFLIPFKFKKVKTFWHHRDSFNIKLYNYFLPLFIDKIVCISNYVKSTLSSAHYNKAFVVYNGVSTDERYYSERNTTFIIGSFGRITEWKRFDLIIKAAHKFQEKYRIHDWKLNIFGDTSVDGSFEYEQSLKTLISDLNITENVRLMGATKEPLVKMSESDVTVNFSKNEPFGRVIIESLIANTPVIVADSGGAPEIIRKTGGGFIARDGDIEDLADQIFKIYSLNDEQYNDLRKDGYTSVKNHFSMENNKEKIRELLI